MKKMLRTYILCAFLLLSGFVTDAQDTLYMTLSQAIDSSQNNNRLIRIFQNRIINAQGKLTEMKSHYYPRVILDGSFAYNSDPNIRLKKGELNRAVEELINIEWIDELITDYFPIPPKDMILLYGQDFFVKSNLGLYQPLSQLTTINTGRKVAETDLQISEVEKENIISQIRLGITELFYGILIETKHEECALYDLDYTTAQYRDALHASEAGEVLPIDVLALEAEIHEKEGELLQIQNKKEQYMLAFSQIIGLADSLVPVPRFDTVSLPVPAPLPEYQRYASQNNFQLELAGLTVQKASLGITAARKGYIPELTAFAQYNYNYGIPLFPQSYLLAGLNLKWTLVASGERKALVNQRNALFNEASEDLQFKTRQIRNEVRTGYLNIVYAQKLIVTAQKALNARQEEYKLAQDAVDEGEALPPVFLQAKADLAKAEVNFLAARLNYQIMIAKMHRLTGEN